MKENLYEIDIVLYWYFQKNGNILWDCIPMLDDLTVNFINSKERLKAIAFSHPHYYST